MTDYDILIVGAGAAGMTAAIYTCRKNLKTLIVSVDIGGQTNMTNHIENYPGTGEMSGTDLMMKFKADAEKFGAKFKTGKITKIVNEGNTFVSTINDKEKIKSRALILTFGRLPRMMNIPGEEKFFGRGVSTCATCDAPLYKGKTVVVVGGGNSGVEAALELSELCEKTYLIHRRAELKADPISVEELKTKKNVEIILSSEPQEIKGNKFVESVIVKHRETEKVRELKVNGLFIEIGSIVDTSIVADLVERNEHGEIKINDRCATSCPGIYAAGDVTTVPFKQTVISAGEGAKAALECYSYLSGGNVEVGDWKKRKK